MNSMNNMADESRDPVLEQALKHFKASVDAWSEAAYHRPRTVASQTGFAAASWKLAASWALGCVLVTGSLAGAVFEHRHRQDLARIAAVKASRQKAAQERAAAEPAAAQSEKPAAAVQQRPAAAEPVKDTADTEDENLLATVDNDVSREVPAAMQPLADLMDDNGTE